MESSLDPRKQCLVSNVLSFLQDELANGNLNDERKESIEVAVQCLETAFELDTDTRTKLEREKIDLLSFIKLPSKMVVSEAQKNEAEMCKNRGNTHMKNSLYNEAVTEYTKGIQLNPTNAVYYCNRAAAYSRLEKHLEAIDDCKEAINLDPTYGKAYGRLGIAYSSLNKFEDARKAYVNALKYDPGNTMYESNLKLAEERLYANMESAAPPEHRPVDISQFINNINNPTLIDMATHMLSAPTFREIMAGIMSVAQSQNDPNIDILLQAGENLARRMESRDPDLVQNLRRTLSPRIPPTEGGAPSEDAGCNSKADSTSDPDKQMES